MWRAPLLAAAALVLAAGSIAVERRGPEIARFCEIGPPEDLKGCPEARLNGGWPMPFLFDAMGVSVVRRLGVEDDLRAGPLMIDWLFYLLVLVGAARVLRRGPRR